MGTSAGAGLVLLALAGAAAAQDAGRGGRLYGGACASCHGEGGQGGPARRTPRIGGQLGWYVAKALADFGSGARRDAEGSPHRGAGLSGGDMADLGAYVAALRPPSPPAPAEAADGDAGDPGGPGAGE